ncbi:hypothetical protein OHC33_011296, partial [Knufia fluminis]
MHQLDQGERLRSFVYDAIESPQATVASITINPDDYPPPLRPVVDDFRRAVQAFLQGLQGIAAATGQADERSDGGVENRTVSAACRLDLLAKASAQAQAVGSETHTADVIESENDAAQEAVHGHGTEPETASTMTSPSVDSARTPALLSPPLLAEVQPKTKASTEKIESDMEENVLRLYPTKAQYLDFPSLLTHAKELGAESTGVFKVVLPEDMPQDFEVVDSDDCPVSVFAATKKTEGVFQLNRKHQRASLHMVPDPAETLAAQALEQFEAALEKESGLDGVAYCTDYDAKTPPDRHDLGLPEPSPIWPFPGNELDRTA